MCTLAEKIQKKALTCGFDKCGIIPISSIDGYDKMFEKRIVDVPDSKYFYKSLLMGMDTKQRFPWAKSVVILVFDYGKFRFPQELQGKYGKSFLLEPEKGSEERFDLGSLERWFSENGIRAEGGEQSYVGPLRYIAMKARLGIVRKNNFFYTETGSYNNLFGYVIDQECELIPECNIAPCSEKCDLCQRACKSGALSAPYTMNPSRCISFLTSFGNCDVPEGLSPEMYEEWTFGCDNCQDACPHNMRHNWNEGTPLPAVEDIAPLIVPENYGNLTDEFLKQHVIPKACDHLQVKDIKALRKNAARSASNANRSRDA